MKDRLRELELENRYLSIVSQFAVDILSINTIEQILWHLAQNVVAKLGFENVVIYMWDEQQQVLIQRAAYGQKSPCGKEIVSPLQIKLGEGVVGSAAQSKQPVLIANTAQVAGYIVDGQQCLSELAVPILIDDKLIGVIDSEHVKQNFYNKKQQDTLVSIACITAINITKTQTIAKLQQSVDELEYSSKIQDTLFEIAELIFVTDSLKQFYQQLHTCIARLTFAGNFYVGLLNESGDTITLPYCVDEVDDVPENEVLSFDLNKPSITGFVLNSNKPLLAYEDQLQSMIASNDIFVKGSLPKAWLGVPFGEGKLRGIVVVQSYNDNYLFQENDKQLLSFVAKHIYNAIERMKARSDLKFLALHDPLTKLPNRSLFADRVEHAIVKIKRTNKQGIAVLFLDLDRFKQVNDNYGHHIGDKLLVQVAAVINSCLRKSDSICRLGGDEFAILLEDVNKLSAVEQVTDKIIDSVQQTFSIEQYQINISTSVGVCYFQKGEVTANMLLIQADEAMYKAKILGRNQVFYYQQSIDKKTVSTYKLERDFLSAIDLQELYLEFQPIVCFESGLIVAAEALIRWQHPELGKIPPGNFLDQVEKSGYMHLLDQYVVRQALAFIKQNLADLDNKFRLNINISGAGFSNQSLLDLIVHKHQSEPQLLQHLCIEITEQTLINNVKQTQVNMKALAAMGIAIALDDFGTGYSSLSYLHQFNFDLLKIDRAFIKNLEQSDDSSIILETIINLAKSLNIKTVAEGIETSAQYLRLKGMQCGRAQGFYMSKSVTEQNFIALLRNNPNYAPTLV
jgi:diguanylate cyclase (GGDEF)-like protein